MLINFAFFITILYAAILFFLWVGWTKFEHPQTSQSQFSVSIIVAAKNAEATIDACLAALAAQLYPIELMQIIVVDDYSTDATQQIMQQFAAQHPQVMVLMQPPQLFNSTKKSALQYAFIHATGEILLFTDADCTPPPTWVQTMLQNFTERTGLIAGFSPQLAKDKKCWSDFLRVDALSAAIVAASTIGWGRGVTCAARNLAVRRQALQDIGGYHNLPDTVSGDDDFLLQVISQHPSWQVNYAMQRDAVVPALGPTDLRKFLHQKTRHISAAANYSPITQFLYAVYHTSNFLLWMCLPIGIFYHPVIVLPFLLKLFLDFVSLSAFALKLHQPVLRGFFIWQPLFLFYNCFAAFTAFRRNISW